MAADDGRSPTARGSPRVAGLALLSAAALAACGASGTTAPTAPATALARIHQAVARTEAAGTAHLAEETDTRSTLGGTSTHPLSADSLRMVGALRFPGPDAELMTTSRSRLPSATPGTSSTTTSTSSSRSIYLGRHLYMGVPPGPVWNELPFRSPFTYLGVVPTRFLATAPGPVTVAGHPEIDGRATTEYLVPVPRSVHEVPLTDSSNRPSTARFTTAPFTLAVWLDDAGRIVRSSGAVVVTSSRPAGTVREVTTTSLSAFGEPVHIVAPAVVRRG